MIQFRSAKHTVCFALVLATAWLNAAGPVNLEQGFRTVPDADKPWVYWWWLNGNVDERTITRDLVAMKAAGFGGLLLFDARGYHDDQNHVIVPPSKMEFMSPEWRRMVKFAMNKADKLGLEVSVNLSSCAGALKGPWAVGDDAPKKLLWTASELRGPQRLTCQLQKPEGQRFWEVAVMAVRHDGSASTNSDGWRDVTPKLGEQPLAAEIVDLTAKVDAQGNLVWDVPAGRWTLLRFGCATMEGHEYDVDILDPKAVEGHFERMGRTLLQDAGPMAGKTLTHFYSVSWEGAAPTWTLGLEKEFTKYRGYPLRPWLPALAGFTLKSREESERFQRDYYKTLGDCFRDNFYGKLHELCGRAGLQWHAESGGPWNRKLAAFEDADQLAFLARTDMPQGEFWFTGSPIKRRQEMNRPSAMTAHAYGQRLAATEAFTHMVQHWSAYPAVLKPFADAAFCDGINQFIWHTFTASPREFGQPGSEYFAGTHINPNVTWFPQAGPFVTYLGRCQFLLRQGRFVSDACAYVGDRPYQHWGRGTNWSGRATLTLPKGHAYDLINTEVLLDRLTVKDGNLVLPDGMSYRLLVVDLEDDTVPPAALRKIAALKKAGAVVVFGQRRPHRALGLANYPAGDAEVQRLAAELWSATPTLADAMSAQRLQPDFEGPWDFTHRRVAEADIYFLSGTGAADCTFRVSGKQPEYWDAVSGKIQDASPWRQSGDGRTIVSLNLPENGSVFVTFRKSGQPRPLAATPPPKLDEMTLNGPWNVRFEPGRGAPKSAVFEQLTPWDQHPDAGIRFFSGRATYRKTFELTAEQSHRAVRLQLGEVKCLAQVRLNGKDLGIVWTDPWHIELASAVKPGRNELEIAVVNTWVNRLVGDAALPKEKRITRSNLALQSGKRALKLYQGFASEDPLMRSGLLGPVRLELGHWENEPTSKPARR
ncbi:MAG: hypothetical protein HZA90_15135 [Verrucomicrobia bacterium]|nr:hypothetical protein [Verrucomicrobiota bacterium]